MRREPGAPVSLHIHRRGRLRAGFVCLASDRVADSDLPFGDGTVARIYVDRTLEPLGLARSVRLLMECRRVLLPGGTIRIVTDDLGAVMRVVSSPDEWKRAGLLESGYDFAQARCEYLNRAFRDGERAWLFDEAEVRRVASLVGLRGGARASPGKSTDPALEGLEHPADRALVMEFKKPVRNEEARPFVSVLIPLYRTRFLHDALASALRQTYENYEILICDDGEEGPAQQIIDGFAGHPGFSRIRYSHNEKRLDGAQNYVRLFEQARGPYIKYLNDDDTLEPRCLERLSACLHANPDVTLATSHRMVIDERGERFPGTEMSFRLVGRDSLISGRSFIREMLRHRNNFAGEPSSVMFRKVEFEEQRPLLWSLAGVALYGNGDVTMWLSLLAQGDAIYLTESLSSFRTHPDQQGADPEVKALGEIGWSRTTRVAEDLGLHGGPQPKCLETKPLLTAPWWSRDVQRLVRSARDSRARGLLAEAQSSLASASAEAPFELAIEDETIDLLLAQGDLVATIKRIGAVMKRAPFYLPAHLAAARAAMASNNPAAAEQTLEATQRLNRLWQAEAGVTRGTDGRSLLARHSRFAVAECLPDHVFVLQISCKNLYLAQNTLVVTAIADGIVSGELELPPTGEAVEIGVPVPWQPARTVIDLYWRTASAEAAPWSEIPAAVVLEGVRLVPTAPRGRASQGPGADRSAAPLKRTGETP